MDEFEQRQTKYGKYVKNMVLRNGSDEKQKNERKIKTHTIICVSFCLWSGHVRLSDGITKCVY